MESGKSNSTNAASAPSLLTVDLNLAYSEASMLDYLTVDLEGNGSTLELEPNINNQFEMDYAPWQTTYNSLVALDFTVVWNRNVDSQNKGLWLDNIVVQSIPEPTTAVMVLFAGLALFRRVRR